MRPAPQVWIVTGFTGLWPGPWNDATPEVRERQLSHVLVFNPRHDSLREECAIPHEHQRGSAGVVAWGGSFYVAQGATDGHLRKYGARKYEGFSRFNPEGCVWTALPKPTYARDHFVAALVGSTMVLAAGRESPHFEEEALVAHFNTDAVEYFDLTMASSGGAWQEGPPIPTPRAGVSATVDAVRGWVVIAGGESDYNGGSGCTGTIASQAHSEVDVYDVASRTWSTLPRLRTGRHTAGMALLPMHDALGNEVSRLVLASGVGCTGGEPLLSDVESYVLTPADDGASDGGQPRTAAQLRRVATKAQDDEAAAARIRMSAVGTDLTGGQVRTGATLAVNLRAYASHDPSPLPEVASLSRDLRACLEEHLSHTYLPGKDAEYETERHCKNRRDDILPEPSAVVRVQTPREVQLAVLCAAASRTPTCARAGQHGSDNDAGCSGGMVVDVQDLRELHVEVGTNLTKFGSGYTLGQLYSQLLPYGLAVPGGTVSDVGAAGLTMGCGRGMLTSVNGLACDIIHSVDYVNAAGQLLTADEATNPDMLFMAKGGGGSFPGIITRFNVRAVAAPDLYVTDCAVPLDHGKALLAMWTSQLQELVQPARKMYSHLSTFEHSGIYNVTSMCLSCNAAEREWFVAKMTQVGALDTPSIRRPSDCDGTPSDCDGVPD